MIRPEILHALSQDELIELTTYGRKTGQPHIIECRFMYAGDKVYVSGFPGKRDWVANIKNNPKALIHIKQSAEAMIQAEGRVVTREKERRSFLVRYMEFWSPINPIEKLVRFFVINSAKVWIRLGLSMWGPMWPIGRIMKRMPLVEFTLLQEV